MHACVYVCVCVCVCVYVCVIPHHCHRDPQLIFAHFHFLLETEDLLLRFMHIVHAQPFESRKKWFYENLHGSKPPSNELSLAAEENVIEVDRGKMCST